MTISKVVHDQVNFGNGPGLKGAFAGLPLGQALVGQPLAGHFIYQNFDEVGTTVADGLFGLKLVAATLAKGTYIGGNITLATSNVTNNRAYYGTGNAASGFATINRLVSDKPCAGSARFNTDLITDYSLAFGLCKSNGTIASLLANGGEPAPTAGSYYMMCSRSAVGVQATAGAWDAFISDGTTGTRFATNIASNAIPAAATYLDLGLRYHPSVAGAPEMCFFINGQERARLRLLTTLANPPAAGDYFAFAMLQTLGASIKTMSLDNHAEYGAL